MLQKKMKMTKMRPASKQMVVKKKIRPSLRCSCSPCGPVVPPNLSYVR